MIIDLHKAIYELWEDQGLNAVFTNYWDSDVGSYLVLNEGEAAAKTPLPYCVYVQETPDVDSRMSGKEINEKQQIINVPFEFIVYAKQNSNRSAKELCAELVHAVMKVFGGSRQPSPVLPQMDNGKCIQVQYISDTPIREDDTIYSWHIRYSFKIDHVMAV